MTHRTSKIEIATVANPNLLLAGTLEHLFPERYTVQLMRNPMELTTAIVNHKPDLIFHTMSGCIQLYLKGAAKDYKLYKPYVFNAVHLIGKRNISSLSDLYGKKVIIAYKQGTPDLTFRAIIAKHKLDQKSITVQYAEPLVAEQLFWAGKADYLILPEFFVSQLLLKKRAPINIHSLEKYMKEPDKNLPIPLAGIFLHNNSKKISISQLDEDLKVAFNFLTQQTPIAAASLSRLFAQRFQMTLAPEVIREAIDTKRVDFRSDLTNADLKEVITAIYGLPAQKWSSFVWK